MEIKYPIVEIFDSIQGEGYWTGIPATFIRLAGCNLKCDWCDTKESWNYNYKNISIKDIVSKINFKHVIITGGEPLLHNLSFLLNQINKNNIIHIETNGTLEWFYSNKNIWVTVSPKHIANYKVTSSILNVANEFKFIVDDNFKPNIIYNLIKKNNINMMKMPIFLSPESVRPEMIQLSIKYIKENPLWRLGLQIHKLINIK